MPTAVIVRNEQPRAREGRGRVGATLAALFHWQSIPFKTGGRRGLYSAARALQEANVDVVIVQETKILDPEFTTQKCTGCDIKVAALGSASCGRVTLLARESYWVRVENTRIIGTNLLSFELVLNKREIFLLLVAISHS